MVSAFKTLKWCYKFPNVVLHFCWENEQALFSCFEMLASILLGWKKLDMLCFDLKTLLKANRSIRSGDEREGKRNANNAMEVLRGLLHFRLVARWWWWCCHNLCQPHITYTHTHTHEYYKREALKSISFFKGKRHLKNIWFQILINKH